MKKFLITIMIFSIAFFVLEKVFYLFIYYSPELEVDKRLEYVVNGEMNKDLIILGSSLGARDIIAEQIEDELGISAYNLSYPGSNIEFHEFILRALIKYNKKPKIVLLTVDEPVVLMHYELIKFRLDRLYPIIKYDYINNEMIERDENTFLSKILALARINKTNLDIRKKHFSELDSLYKCGSMPIPFQKQNYEFAYDNDNVDYKVEDESELNLKAFEKLQELCVSNDIKLIIVFTPIFKNHNVLFENRIKELSAPAVEYIIHDTTNLVYKNKKYYYDEYHLKINGAIIFTNEIVKYLKNNHLNE